MGARTYDQTLGRFLQIDPLFEKFPNQSPYSYAYNNPMTWKDPTGLAPEREGKSKNQVQAFEKTNAGAFAEADRSQELLKAGYSEDFLFWSRLNDMTSRFAFEDPEKMKRGGGSGVLGARTGGLLMSYGATPSGNGIFSMGGVIYLFNKQLDHYSSDFVFNLIFQTKEYESADFLSAVKFEFNRMFSMSFGKEFIATILSHTSQANRIMLIGVNPDEMNAAYPTDDGNPVLGLFSYPGDDESTITESITSVIPFFNQKRCLTIRILNTYDYERDYPNWYYKQDDDDGPLMSNYNLLFSFSHELAHYYDYLTLGRDRYRRTPNSRQEANADSWGNRFIGYFGQPRIVRNYKAIK